MQRIATQQDRVAFGLVFGHFAPRLKSFLLRTGSAEGVAEELVQDTLVAVWGKAARFDPSQAALSTWIFTIARRLRIDSARKGLADRAGDECFEFDLLPSPHPDLEDRADAEQQARRLRSALDMLPAEQAQVLRLSFYEEEPHARIAQELGLPLGTVKSRIRLAVAQLRRLLQT